VPRLSAIIITQKEAANIAACLDTLPFCDKRILDAATYCRCMKAWLKAQRDG
jgi:hypothetical protein